MEQELCLMNFRINPVVKEQFEKLCSDLQTNMTAELNRLIRNYLHEAELDKELIVRRTTKQVDEIEYEFDEFFNDEGDNYDDL